MNEPTQNDGGPAFPRGSTLKPNGAEWTLSQEGMSLRDYFAGKALAGIQSNPDVGTDLPENIAKWAYESADAMMKARAAK